MSNYQYQARDSQSITFENPLNPRDIVRVKRTVSPKVVDKLPLTNVRSDVSILRAVDPRTGTCIDCNQVLEPLSARVILSGSNAAELKNMWKTISALVFSEIDTLLRGSLPTDNTVIVIDPA